MRENTTVSYFTAGLIVSLDLRYLCPLSVVYNDSDGLNLY